MKKLIQAAVVTLFAASAAQAREAVQWRVEDGGNGHWYALDSTLASWSVASTSAALRGAHLATLTTPAEQSFVSTAVYRVTGFSDTWLGASRADCASPFVWVTGEAFTGAPAGTGFDRDCLGWAGPGTGNFVEHVIRKGTIFGWETESDDANIGNFSLVEWSADCNNDGIVDYGQILDGSLSDVNADGVPDACQAPCVPSDLNNDGAVDGSDLGALLSDWGPAAGQGTRADINGDGIVNGADLGTLLANWGACS